MSHQGARDGDGVVRVDPVLLRHLAVFCEETADDLTATTQRMSTNAARLGSGSRGCAERFWAACESASRDAVERLRRGAQDMRESSAQLADLADAVEWQDQRSASAINDAADDRRDSQ
ncbi:MAG: hypothetical protein ACRD0P_18605 [Stackebrandtia sp.]